MRMKLLGAVVVALVALPATATAAEYAVTETTDHVPNGCVPNDCTLREAVIAANGGSTDEITIPAGTYRLTLQGSNEDSAQTGDLDLTDDQNTTISGAGATTTVIDGARDANSDDDRVFDVHPTAAANIQAVMIRNGQITSGASGAGIRSEGSILLLQDAVIVANVNGSDTGGIQSTGDILFIMERSTVAKNGSTAAAGAAAGGLSILDAPAAAILSSTFTGNFGPLGGAIVASDVLNVTNSTFSGNTATGTLGAGGIYKLPDGGPVNLDHVTVAGNTDTGGAVANIRNAGATAGVTLEASIVAKPLGGSANCGGSATPPLTSQGDNIEDADSCGLGVGDLLNTDPQLAPLGDYGGTTATRALYEGSPAIDAITTGCPPPDTDQRGFLRPAGGGCDIGAFEGSIPRPGAGSQPPPIASPPAAAPPATTAPRKRCKKGRKLVRRKGKLRCVRKKNRR